MDDLESIIAKLDLAKGRRHDYRDHSGESIEAVWQALREVAEAVEILARHMIRADDQSQ